MSCIYKFVSFTLIFSEILPLSNLPYPHHGIRTASSSNVDPLLSFWFCWHVNDYYSYTDDLNFRLIISLPQFHPLLFVLFIELLRAQALLTHAFVKFTAVSSGFPKIILFIQHIHRYIYIYRGIFLSCSGPWEPVIKHCVWKM